MYSSFDSDELVLCDELRQKTNLHIRLNVTLGIELI